MEDVNELELDNLKEEEQAMEIGEESHPIPVEDDKEKPETNIKPTIEGFEKELAIVDEVMKVRLDYLRNNKNSIISGALSGKDMEAANSMMSALSSEAMGKIKLVKDSAMAEAKQNSEATMLAMMSALLTERTSNLQNVTASNTTAKLEVKKLDNFDLKEDEIKIKGD